MIMLYLYLHMIFDDLMYLSNEFGWSIADWKQAWYNATLELTTLPVIPWQVPIEYVALTYCYQCACSSWREATIIQTNQVPTPTNPDFFLVNSTSQVWANDIFQEPDPFPEIKEDFLYNSLFSDPTMSPSPEINMPSF